MAVNYKGNEAICSDLVSVDDAEPLLEWLQAQSAARIDLSGCMHLHPANLQVLMAAKAVVSAWPTDNELASWLKGALATS
jgi:hypothetical protein